MATYDKNDRVRLTATFTSDGAAAAATVVCTHRKPSGADTTVTTSGGGTGIYIADVTLDQIGTHTIRFAGTGAVIATEVAELVVGKSVFDHS